MRGVKEARWFLICLGGGLDEVIVFFGKSGGWEERKIMERMGHMIC